MLDGVIAHKVAMNAHSLANFSSNSISSVVAADPSYCFFFFFGNCPA
jgi:hypothetical protein